MYLDGLWVYANFLLDSLYQNFLSGYFFNQFSNMRKPKMNLERNYFFPKS